MDTFFRALRMPLSVKRVVGKVKIVSRTCGAEQNHLEDDSESRLHIGHNCRKGCVGLAGARQEQLEADW